VTGGEHPGLHLRRGDLPSFRGFVGGALGIAMLVALVPILAGVRAEFAPWGPLWPKDADGIRLYEVAFALISAFGTGIGLVAVTSVAIFALIAAGRRYDAAFVGLAVFGATILSRVLKYYFHAARPSSPESIASAISVADAIVAIAVGIAIAILLLTRWRAWTIAGLAVAIAAVALEAGTGKLLPLTAGFDAFPSGHAVYSMALAAAVAPLAWRSRAARYPVLAGLLLYVLGVGLTRVYLRAHVPADVVGGWCVALAWTIGCRLLWAALAPSSDVRIVADSTR
jgi:membrane-associated phospholipid phosphatase